MANRDYAATVDPEERKKHWASITNGIHLTTDWESAPLLIPGLREGFPDLLSEPVPLAEPCPVPADSEISQPGQPTARLRDTQHVRIDSVQNGNSKVDSQRDSRTTVQGGITYQGSTHRRPSQRSHPRQDSRQYQAYRPEPGTAPDETHRGRPYSVLWNAELYGDPRSAPVPSTRRLQSLTHRDHGLEARHHGSAASHPHQQQRNDSRASSLHVNSSPMHPVSRSTPQSIRRRPGQSRLRDERPSQHNGHHEYDPEHDQEPSNPVPQMSGYSHYPLYSPLRISRPHTLAPTHITLPPSTTHPTLSKLQGSLLFSPPLASPLPPHPAHQSHTSVSTFTRPSRSPRPALTQREAQVLAIKQHIAGRGRGLGEKLVAVPGRVGRGWRKATEYKIKRARSVVSGWKGWVRERIRVLRRRVRGARVEGSVVVFGRVGGLEGSEG